MSDASTIIKAALAAHTMEQTLAVQAMIAKAVGATYQRPIGDRWSNVGLLTRVGSTDTSCWRT
jgi:hypothetical protein